LRPGTLWDYTFHRNIISDSRWTGRFVPNTLWIREQLGRDTVAERLLRNLIRYAAVHAAGATADLPPSFNEQIKAFGYCSDSQKGVFNDFTVAMLARVAGNDRSPPTDRRRAGRGSPRDPHAAAGT